MARSRRNRFATLLFELKRRRVFRVAAVYVVAAFAALQGADILVPALNLPPWTMTLLVVLAIVGTPVAVGLAWAFDIVPGGIERTRDWTEEPGPAASGGSGTTGPAAAASAARLPGSDAAVLPAGGSPAATPSPAVNPSGDGPLTPSVAVMPFLNLSPDPENEYFADGITEDVIAHLSRIGGLKIISRASVMPFKAGPRSPREIGLRLGVGTVLDGSVRRVGDRVRIVAQLVDAATDRQLWAETYDRDLTDIFAIQTDVALHIAIALRAELSPEEQSRVGKKPTANLHAYHDFLKARHLFIRYTPESLHRAIEYFGRAVTLDPEYSEAWVGIAMAYAELAEDGVVPADLARSRATDAVGRALRLDPNLGEAHCAAGHLKAIWDFDWAGAEAEFRRAIELCPSSADAYNLYGRLCAALGRLDEALVLHRRAQELDPLAHRLDVATTLLRAGRWQEAAADARRAIEFEPDYDRAHATLAWALIKQNRVEEGLAELRKAMELSGGETQWLAQLGQALALVGRTAEAREVLRDLTERAETGYVSPYHLAFVHAGLGEHDRAIDLLARAFAERSGAIYAIRGSFLLAPLRAHPRFQELLERLGGGRLA